MLASNEIWIKRAGLNTSVQDLGRQGFMSKGVARSGAMDQYSACLANWLVSNAIDTALLETTLQGLSMSFRSNCFIAITGADLGAELNGKEIDRYQTIQVVVGDELVFKRRKSGLYAYLAITGGIDSQEIMGSASMHSMIDLGIGKLSNGSVVHFHPARQIPAKRLLPKYLIPVYSQHFTARITRGPEFDEFPEEFITQLEKESLTITADSNRMGYRLKGNLFEKGIPKGIVSSGVIPGTIQITSSGQPIILMNDGPTTGGYPRIANIISPDLNHVAQLGPGDTIRLKWISFEEAESLLEGQQKVLSRFTG